MILYYIILYYTIISSNMNGFTEATEPLTRINWARSYDRLDMI